MSSRQSRLQEDTNFRVLRLLNLDPSRSQRDLAQALGISVGGLNYCLKALIERGWIEIKNFSASEHKMHYAYMLTPQGLSNMAQLARQFLVRKMEEYEVLKLEINHLQHELAHDFKAVEDEKECSHP